MASAGLLSCRPMSTASADPAHTTLSESDSAELVSSFGVLLAEHELAPDVAAAVEAATKVGYPVAVKLCGDRIAHKTERDLVRLGLGDAPAVEAAASELLSPRRDPKTARCSSWWLRW